MKTDLEKVRDYYEKQCKKYKLDPQNHDIIGEYDGGLNFNENKTKIDNFIQMSVPLIERANKEDIEKYQRDIERHTMELIHEHNTEHFRQLNTEPNKTLDLIDKPIHDAVNLLCKTSIPLLIIDGRTGNGKSFAVDTQIKREGADNRSKIYTTTVTRAFLYRIGYENREKGRILIFRDIDLFRKDLIDTIKAMCETSDKPRMIYKNAFSKENDSLPDFYQFEGSVIIEVNNIPQDPTLKADISALMSRAIYVPFHLSHDEIKAKMKVIAGDEEWKKEVTEVLTQIENVDINLRTQYYTFKIFEWAKLVNKDWREIVEKELRRISRPKIYWRIWALTGDRWVKKVELVKMLVTYEGYSVRSGQRMVKDLIEGQVMYEQGNCVGLVPLKM